MNVLQTTNLSKTYYSNKGTISYQALSAFDLSVSKGEFVGIMGPSGSGFLHNMSESDLFYEAQSLPFPVEVQMKIQTESKSITKPALNLKRQQLKEEQKEQQSTGDRSDVSTVTSATMIRHLQDEIKKEDVHVMNWLSVIVVHGKTKKECVGKATIVKRHLKGAGITCRLPVADQLNLFYKMLPGEKLDITDKNWIQKTTQEIGRAHV